MLLEVKWDFMSLFQFYTVILLFLMILKNCQASSKLEAVNSTWLSSCQRHVRPLCEMKWRLRAFVGSLKGTQTSFDIVI